LTNQSQISEGLTKVNKLFTALIEDEARLVKIDDLIEKIVFCLASGGKLMFAGNGGSAAEAQHMAAEYVNKFRFDRPAMAALSLTTDTSVLTSIANDYSFDSVFSRQIEALGKPGDVFIGYSTSGTSKNIIRAIEAAKSAGIYTVMFVGVLASPHEETQRPDLLIEAGTAVTSNAQEVHLAIGHLVAEIVERRLNQQKS